MFNWFSFLTYAVITAVTPGPNNIMSMTNGARKGFRAALPFNLGIWIGFSIVMLLCTALCQLLGTLIPRIRLPMLLLGAAYMLYLAWETFRNSGDIQGGRAGEGFLSGLFLQFVNAKISLYCVMSMEAYILPVYQGRALPLACFALLLAFIGFGFTLCGSAFGSAFKLLFSRHAKLVNILMALLLVYGAASLFM